jgi:hypothetical protein
MPLKNKTIIFLIFALTLFLLSRRVNGLITPQIYFTKLDISKENFKPGEKIKGQVSLWNYEKFLVSDLVFYFYILGEEINGVPIQVIDIQKGEEIISISPGEKINKPFVYTLPVNLPTGDFIFRIRLVNSRGEEMGWIDKKIHIGGRTRFLNLENIFIVKEEKEFPVGKEEIYQPGVIPKIHFDVLNSSNFSIQAFYKIITYRRSAENQIIDQIEGETFTFEPKIKKTIETNFPKIDQPGFYLTEIRLFDSKTRKPISNLLTFSWRIPNPDEVNILFAYPDKDSYRAGEEAKIQIQYKSPINSTFQTKKGKIMVQLLNEAGKLVGEGEKEVEMGLLKTEIAVPIKQNVNHPKILVEIEKEGKVLDRYELDTKQSLKKEKSSFVKENKILLAILILVFISLIIYLLKRKKTKILIFLISILTGISLGPNLLAVTEVDHSCQEIEVTWNTPLPDQTFKPGDKVRFSGKFKPIPGKEYVGFTHNRIEVYITEDRDIPLKPAGCSPPIDCSKCKYGGDYCIEFDAQWCGWVETLDLSKYRSYIDWDFYKLGEVSLPDLSLPGEYSFEFQIPEDLEFYGPVRFYLVYSGVFGDYFWIWEISYQKGKIEVSSPPPSVNYRDTKFRCSGLRSSMKCIRTFPYYNPQGDILQLMWFYSDPDGDLLKRYSIEIQQLLNGTWETKLLCERHPFYSKIPPGDEWKNPQFIVVDIYPGCDDPISDGSSYCASWSYIGEAITYGNPIRWRIRARDSHGFWSNWSSWFPSEAGFPLPPHPYPAIEFGWYPNSPAVNQPVKFSNLTYVAGDIKKAKWEWAFDRGTPTSSQLQNPPPVTFHATGTFSIFLKVTDEFGQTCLRDKEILISTPTPPPTPSENQPPTASFSCDSSKCSGGSGDSNCIMYQPTSDINTCIFKLVNNSSDPDGTISQTKWYIKKKIEPDNSYSEIGSCSGKSGKCDHTIQKNDVPDPGIYTVKLYVEDNKGASASVTRDLTVKREISAEFKCSLDNSNWKSCEDIKLFPGQTIFVKDYSSPSEGATINSWTWQKGDGTNFETFAQNTTNASTTLTISQKFIRLIVSDNASRTDRQDHQVSVTYPLPFFKEIPPIFFKIREFFASLIPKFK